MVKIALAHFMKNKEPGDLVTKLSEVRGGVVVPCRSVGVVTSCSSARCWLTRQQSGLNLGLGFTELRCACGGMDSCTRSR
jgi:hypothetical protein